MHLLSYICSFPDDEILPGRQVPPECHAELHSDYGGIAVRWGLTHHRESASDCCQACLDHARNAKPGENKCNIWVYCPSETGCYSPDIYEHKHTECWLKYVSFGCLLTELFSHFSLSLTKMQQGLSSKEYMLEKTENQNNCNNSSFPKNLAEILEQLL